MSLKNAGALIVHYLEDATEPLPIETAPMDGRKILAFRKGSGWMAVYAENGLWVSSASLCHLADLTHWMLMPPDPA